jgi:hypothetical protein
MQSAETVLDVGIATGEPGDRKRSRRVVCPANGYVEDGLSRRCFSCSAGFRRVMRST